MKFLYHHRTQGHQVEAIHIGGIVNGLGELGHDVELVSFPGIRLETRARKGDGIPSLMSQVARRLPPGAFTLLEIAYNAFTLVRLGLRLLLRRPDAIYERYSLFLFATVLLARILRIPIVLEINDSALVERVRPLRFSRLARAIERWCFRKATGLVFISHRFLQMARDNYGAIAPAVVSPNAVDTGIFDPSRFDRARLRERLGVEDCIVAGYVGGFIHWHGVSDFVTAIAGELLNCPRLRLLLIGDGVEYAPIHEFVQRHGLSDRILLPGRIGHDQIPEMIACMDFAILPNSNEYGSPMKLFEFMAMEVPVLAPDYGPVREVIADGETGWLFPKLQTQAAVDKTLQLANGDAENLRAVGRAACEYIRRERRWVNNVEQFLPLYPHTGRSPT